MVHLIVDAGSGPSATPDAARIAAKAVVALFPEQVIEPSSSLYSETQNTLWNQRQRENAPACFFLPQNAEQVQAAIVEVARAGSTFSIRGGGHSSNARGSSITGGFSFDLSNLNHVEIAQDRKSLRVGPGVHWGVLFQEIEQHGLMVLGGRDFGVGVPGFIFGGGLSFYTALHGWAIDHLVSADVVLANGELVTASNESHSDLYRALRGGGAHNFGIVTSLTLKAYPYQGVWGGLNVITEEQLDANFEAFDKYTRDLQNDGKAHMITDFYRRDGVVNVCHTMGYPEAAPDPPIFDGIRALPNIFNSLRLANVSELASEVAISTDCRGKRNMYWTHAFEYDLDMFKSWYELWAKRTKPNEPRFRFALSINHVTPEMRKRAARDGVPNVYGLEDSDAIMIISLFTCTWADASDDEEATAILRKLSAEAEALARQRGKFHPFKYMNYAHAEQEVIAGFGDENQAFLQQVATKYDPAGVFQKLQPGGFKLDMMKSGQRMW